MKQRGNLYCTQKSKDIGKE